MAKMLEWLGGRTKPLKVKVTTMDADLNAISVDRDAPGQQLFDMVCKIIGLRELWYFGLCFSNRKGFTCWLQMDKEIRKQAVPKQPDGSLHFLFLVKFFPESVKAELIQDLTRHLFFLQIRQSVLSMDLYCPSEAAILLASYACQAIYGDQNEDIELDLAKLIPPSVIQQYDMSAEMWDEKIRNWWANNAGLCREDAEEEFLCVAEELDMYGIQYYPIRNQRDTELLLGVSAQGLGIYEPDNKLSPRPFFPWTEIKCISFKNKMFTIYTADKSKIRFRAQDMSINQSLLDLCVGTHNLYLRRRQPDLLEVQQMRMQAREQRQRRLAEQSRLQSEREQRVQAEMERDKLRTELGHLAEQLNAMQSVVKSAEETNQLIVERARLSEKEAQEMARRATNAETEMQRIRFNQRLAEESKIVLEKKVHDVESMAQRLIIQQQQRHQQQQNGSGNGSTLVQPPPPYQEHQPRTSCSGRSSSNRQQTGAAAGCATSSVSLDDEEQPNQQPQKWRQQQQQLAHQAQNVALATNENGNNNVGGGGAAAATGSTTTTTNVLLAKNLASPQRNGAVARCGSAAAQQQIDDGEDSELVGGGGEGNEGALMMPTQLSRSIDAELQYIYAELKQSREWCNEKNRSLREKFKNFRADMEKLKREGADTELDRIFAQKMKTGCFDKHSTLRKSGAGTSKSRAQYFNEMTAKQPATTVQQMSSTDS